MRYIRLVLLYILITFSFYVMGCDYLNGQKSVPDNFSGQHIETNKETYKWEGDSLTIEYVYKNPFEKTVFMAGCGADNAGPAYLLEKRTERGWVTAHHRICLLRFAIPTPIEPKETYEATFELDERKVEGLTQPSWQVDSVPGTYRVREPMYWTWDKEKHKKGTLEKTGTWLSNEFKIR